MAPLAPLRVALVGVGLIGSSLVQGLRAAGRIADVVGLDSSAAALRQATQLGIVDQGVVLIDEPDPRLLRDRDLIIVAAPIAATVELIRRIDALVPDFAGVITDVASVKRSVVAAVGELRLARRFVPGHPIAGSEQSGPLAARADLFQGCRVILTPAQDTAADAVALVSAVWEAVGSQVATMAAAQHDLVMAQASHLPHAVAFALVDYLGQAESPEQLGRFTGGGFRDLSRLAASDSAMWRDIFLANSAPVSDGLRALAGVLEELAERIDDHDGAALEALCARARSLRGRMLDPPADADIKGKVHEA